MQAITLAGKKDSFSLVRRKEFSPSSLELKVKHKVVDQHVEEETI